MTAILRSALSDVKSGWRFRPLWVALATEDIGDQHRRTALGPLWLLINYLLFVGVFILVFGQRSGIPYFTAYSAIGMLIFLYIQEVTLQAVSLFIREEGFIAGTRLPLTVYVLRLTTQSLIRFLYASAGCVLLVAMGGAVLSPNAALSLIGIVNLIVATPAVIIVLAFMGAYFPDSQFIVANAMRIMMFLTPIFWSKGYNHVIDTLYHFNPLTHYIESIRSPFVYGSMIGFSMYISISITCLFWILAIFLLGRYRTKIVFLI